MKDTPTVSVLTTVFNTELFVRQSIRSVRDQTFEDWEHIIVDDASTDGTPAILEEAAQEDERLSIVRLPQNLGPGGAMQAALDRARGEFVAILDADDESLPARLERQVRWMEAHPETVLLGTGRQKIDEQGDVLSEKEPTVDREKLLWACYGGMPLTHSSVMMRTDALRRVGGYDQAMWTMCDYDVVLRMSAVGALDCLPETLVRYRVFDRQLSKVHHRKQKMQMVLRITSLLRQWLGFRVDARTVEIWYTGLRGIRLPSDCIEPYLAVQEEILARHLQWRGIGVGAAHEIELRRICAERTLKQWLVQQSDDEARRRLREGAERIAPAFDCDVWLAANVAAAKIHP